MTTLWLPLLTIAVLCASAAAGFRLQPLLAEEHRARATIEVVWLIVGLIVTFAAVLLGLLVSSQKASFDQSRHDRAVFAADLVQLDQCLRDYGPDAEPVRRLLIEYTASSIAATWPTRSRRRCRPTRRSAGCRGPAKAARSAAC